MPSRVLDHIIGSTPTGSPIPLADAASGPTLYTLGRLALVDASGAPLLSPGSTKPLALLAYIVAAPGRRVSRERLIDQFFDGMSATNARNGLRQALHKLRTVLGPEVIPAGASGDEVVVGVSLECDRDIFLDAVDQGDLATAIACYQGPFAAEAVSAGSAGFEQWADHERATLAERFSVAIDVVAHRALQHGDPRTAAELAQRVLDHNRYDQRAWRLRLTAEIAAGSRVHIAATVAELRRLNADGDLLLDGPTTRLMERAARPVHVEEIAPDHQLVANLVGRDREFALLYQAWRDAQGGNGGHVHVTGEAGAGKTRLLEDFARRITSERGAALTVSATPRLRLLGASALARLVAAAGQLGEAKGISSESARILVQLHPALGSHFAGVANAPSPASDARLSRSGALADLLGALSDDRTFCLIIDDLHWWDPESLHVLADVIDQLPRRRLLIVTASRPARMELSTSVTRARVIVASLAAEDVLVLILSLAEAAEDDARPFATAVCNATGGNPLAVMQALRLGLDLGHIAIRDGHWNLDRADELIASLAPGMLIATRIERIPERQRVLLLLLAVCERPVDIPDIAPAGDHVAGDLLELEREGFARNAGDGWAVVHDLVGEAVVATSTALQVSEAHRAAASLWQASGDTDGLRIALAHAVAAADHVAQAAITLQHVRARRAEGDRRNAGGLVRDLAGPTVGDGGIERLIASLPSHLRRPPMRPWMVPLLVAAVTVVATSLGWVWSMRPRPEPQLVLLASDGAANAVEHSIALDDRTLEGSGPLLLQSRTNWPWRGSLLGMTNGPTPSPDDSEWVYSREVNTEDGPTDLVLRSKASERVLAPFHGDDVDASWSPDGEEITFSTTRYPNSGGTFDIASVNLRTSAVRRLTATPDQEISPLWSPAGTRIAFIRHPQHLGPDQLCWVTVDAARERCREVADLSRLTGWESSGRILAIVRHSTGTAQLQSIAVDSTADDFVTEGFQLQASSSPDGRLIAAVTSHTQSDSTMQLEILAADHHSPIRASPIAAYSGYQFIWWASDRAPFVQRIVIMPAADTLTINATVQLAIVGTSDDGQPINVNPAVIEWRTLDSTVAIVDSVGVLHPLRSGRVTVFASAGGWRSASRTYTIVDAPARIVLREGWSPDWLKRWHLYGVPLPVLVKDGAGRPAMFPNGDDTYSSGAYTREQFDARHGLALDVRLQTPITRSWLQHLAMYIGSINGFGHDSEPGTAGGCAFEYPEHEGGSGVRVARITNGIIPVDSTLASGRWYSARLQFFPDGTCGGAIEGRAVYRGTARHNTRDSMIVVIDGQTYLGKLLVGPLTVWEGVAPGVDWGTLQPPRI